MGLSFACILELFVRHSLEGQHSESHWRNHRTQQEAVLRAKTHYRRRTSVGERHMGGVWRNPHTSFFMLSPSFPGLHSLTMKCSHMCAMRLPGEAHQRFSVHTFFMGAWSYRYPLSSTFRDSRIPEEKQVIQHKSE